MASDSGLEVSLSSMAKFDELFLAAPSECSEKERPEVDSQTQMASSYEKERPENGRFSFLLLVSEEKERLTWGSHRIHFTMLPVSQSEANHKMYSITGPNSNHVTKRSALKMGGSRCFFGCR